MGFVIIALVSVVYYQLRERRYELSEQLGMEEYKFLNYLRLGAVVLVIVLLMIFL